MAVAMAPIDSAAQNAENAHFTKRAILVEILAQNEKLPVLRKWSDFSFSLLCLRDTRRRFLLSLFLHCIFPL